MTIIECESKKIIEKISPIFWEYLNQYNENKYPPGVYAELKETFSNPANVEKGDIENALKWKYGHYGKSDFTGNNKKIISDVQNAWSDFEKSIEKNDPETTFNWWNKKLGKNRFITKAFITHLVHHKKGIPIIDQHNFRAMQSLIHDVRNNYEMKDQPARWNDINRLQDFIGKLTGQMEVSENDMDRFLMMYGKSKKVRYGKNSKALVAAKNEKERVLMKSNNGGARQEITTCGRNPTRFEYTGSVDEGVILHFDTGDANVSKKLFVDLLSNFAKRKDVKAGVSMTSPPSDGIGAWVQENSRKYNSGNQLTPRHASFIIAILLHEKKIECRLNGNAVIVDFK